MTTPAVGPFTCDVTLRVIRAPTFGREEREGVTDLVGRDYEPAYETILQFPVSGYVRGQTVISGAHGSVLFRGRYYDSRVVQSLSGDDTLTPTGPRLVDHLENRFSEGPYAGHAFSLGVRLMREGTAPMAGQGRGEID